MTEGTGTVYDYYNPENVVALPMERIDPVGLAMIYTEAEAFDVGFAAEYMSECESHYLSASRYYAGL